MRRDVERAWAAGFFDGEGSTICVEIPRECRRLDLVVGQVNRDNLVRFQAAVGGEGVIGKPRFLPGRKPIQQFVATGESAQRCLRVIWPFLSAEKREQAIRALVKWSFRPVTNRGNLPVCRRRHVLADVGVYIAPDGAHECLACRALRRLGKVQKPNRIFAYEVRLGLREYVPAAAGA